MAAFQVITEASVGPKLCESSQKGIEKAQRPVRIGGASSSFTGLAQNSSPPRKQHARFLSGKGALAPVYAKFATGLKRFSLDRNPLEARG